jgi:hypothetical protein
MGGVGAWPSGVVSEVPCIALVVVRRRLRLPHCSARATQWDRSAPWVSDRYVLQVGIDDPGYRRRLEGMHPEIGGKRTILELELQAGPQGSS